MGMGKGLEICSVAMKTIHAVSINAVEVSLGS